MIIVLSPAKSLDYETPPHVSTHTVPQFVDDAAELIDGLRELSPAQVGSLMSISDQLAALNVTRYADWNARFDTSNAKQAVLAFNGDVYEGLAARTLSATQLDFAQKHLRILSGLYGVLRPLDLLQPYRLEMGTRFANKRGRDLYAFWGERVTQTINASLAEHTETRRVLVNLASEEYFKVIKRRLVAAGVRGLEERQVQDHQLLCQARARSDGALRHRARRDRRAAAQGLRQRRLRVRRHGLERRALGLPPSRGLTFVSLRPWASARGF